MYTRLSRRYSDVFTHAINMHSLAPIEAILTDVVSCLHRLRVSADLWAYRTRTREAPRLARASLLSSFESFRLLAWLAELERLCLSRLFLAGTLDHLRPLRLGWLHRSRSQEECEAGSRSISAVAPQRKLGASHPHGAALDVQRHSRHVQCLPKRHHHHHHGKDRRHRRRRRRLVECERTHPNTGRRPEAAPRRGESAMKWPVAPGVSASEVRISQNK